MNDFESPMVKESLGFDYPSAVGARLTLESI
jgi:hypothetical protein